MKSIITLHIILLSLWASPALSLGLENRCSDSFQSNAKVAIQMKMSPSFAVSRGRYEIEDFIVETIGAEFLRGERRIQVDINVNDDHFEDTLSRLSALGITPVVSDEEPVDDSIIMVMANSRDLINLLRELAPSSYFLASTYDPRSEIFGLEI